MSYILDALKRADSERERGTVPSLRSQSTTTASPVSRPRKALRAMLIAAAVVLVLLLASFIPVLLEDEPQAVQHETTGSIETGPPAGVPPVANAPATAPEPATAPTPAAPTDAPALTSEAPPSPILAPAPPRPTPPSASVAAGKAPATTATNLASASVTDATVGGSPTVAGKPGAPKSSGPAPEPARVPTFAELSAEARAQLPQVNVSGSSYSANAAHRMLIANGKVVQEGQEISPGLTLERISQHSAVLNHKGLRYSIGY